MQERKLDILSDEALEMADAICITTNGNIKKDGTAVMGAGVAKGAALKWPTLPTVLAEQLRNRGNVPSWLHHDIQHGCDILSFPTKHDWKEKSDLGLITVSALWLEFLVNGMGYKCVLLPPPGCGHGGLTKKEVYPAIEEMLDDRFIICYI